jgi:hypothetical protein
VTLAKDGWFKAAAEPSGTCPMVNPKEPDFAEPVIVAGGL